MACSTFTRFHIHIPGVSIDFSTGENAQFDTHATVGGSTLLGYYMQFVFQMANYAGAYTDRERGLFGVHYVNTTGGDPDLTWTNADFAAVEAAALAGWDAVASSIGADFKAIEQRWYAFGPGIGKPNPPVRITAISGSHLGTAGQNNPHQMATTVTLRTPLRRHWGRIYLPMAVATLNTHGQQSSAGVDAILNSVKGILTGAEASQGIVPVVYDRVRGQALGVTALEMDSVPDVVRRRRPRDTGYRKVLTS